MKKTIKVDNKNMILDTKTGYIYETEKDQMQDTPYMHYEEL